MTTKGQTEQSDSGEKRDKINVANLREMLERQEYRCALSGRELRPETASLDHKQPLSRGGGHFMDNVHIVDSQVNVAKGTLNTEEFLRMCKDVADWNA